MKDFSKTIMSRIACFSHFSDTWGKDAALLSLRLFATYEFWEAGIEKWNGQNWFADIQSAFPFPFNLFPSGFNWTIAMSIELVAPLLLLFGLFGRVGTLMLMILTVVAWLAVHGDNGYNVCNNGYKMALIYLVVLLPLVLQGMGRFSLDYLLFSRYIRTISNS